MDDGSGWRRARRLVDVARAQGRRRRRRRPRPAARARQPLIDLCVGCVRGRTLRERFVGVRGARRGLRAARWAAQTWAAAARPPRPHSRPPPGPPPPVGASLAPHAVSAAGGRARRGARARAAPGGACRGGEPPSNLPEIDAVASARVLGRGNHGRPALARAPTVPRHVRAKPGFCLRPGRRRPGVCAAGHALAGLYRRGGRRRRVRRPGPRPGRRAGQRRRHAQARLRRHARAGGRVARRRGAHPRRQNGRRPRPAAPPHALRLVPGRVRDGVRVASPARRGWRGR